MARDHERRFQMNLEKLEGRSLTTILGGASSAWVSSVEGGHATADFTMIEHPNALNAYQKVHGQNDKGVSSSAG
jgi:hypothetical protein